MGFSLSFVPRAKDLARLVVKDETDPFDGSAAKTSYISYPSPDGGKDILVEFDQDSGMAMALCSFGGSLFCTIMKAARPSHYWMDGQGPFRRSLFF